MIEIKLVEDFGQVRDLSVGPEIGKACDILKDHLPDVCFAPRQTETITLQEPTLSKDCAFDGGGDLGRRHIGSFLRGGEGVC
jgi:hypothetical protein